MEISFKRRNGQRMDITISGGDVVLGDDLETAVSLSIFTNARASDPVLDINALSQNQGWWGDVHRDSPLGSLFWQYRRSKKTATVLELVRVTLKESLEWLVEDGVAESVLVQTKWDEYGDGRMNLKIDVKKPTGGSSSFEYQFAWDFLGGQ